jgi:integrase
MDGIRTTNEVQSLQRVVGKLKAAQSDLARQVAPIAEAWRLYLASPARPDSGPSTLQQYGAEWQRLARWLAKDAPGVSTLALVTDRHAMAYAGTLATVSGSTFNQHIGFLRLMWRVLDIEPSPWRNIRCRRRSAAGRRELSLDELKAVLSAASGELKTLLTVGLYTGMRLGDCCLLRWQDINAGVIRITPAKTSRSGKTIAIPVHPILAKALGKGKKGFIVPELAKDYQHDRSIVTKAVKAHFEACDLETQTDRAGKRKGCLVGFHSLRHTFVSLCRQAGAPLAIVEAIVGHSNPAMTRHYTHVGDDAARAAVGMLPKV